MFWWTEFSDASVLAMSFSVKSWSGRLSLVYTSFYQWASVKEPVWESFCMFSWMESGRRALMCCLFSKCFFSISFCFYWDFNMEHSYKFSSLSLPHDLGLKGNSCYFSTSWLEVLFLISGGNINVDCFPSGSHASFGNEECLYWHIDAFVCI